MSSNFPHFNMEPIEAALFAQLKTAIGTGANQFNFKTATRNPGLPQNTLTTDQPLLGLVNLGASQVESQAQGLEKWLLHFRVLVYIRADASAQSIPSTLLNNALQAIVFAMRSAGGTFERQTLGGLVDNAYVTGDILRDNGNIDQQCAMMIPIIVDVGV